MWFLPKKLQNMPYVWCRSKNVQNMLFIHTMLTPKRSKSVIFTMPTLKEPVYARHITSTKEGQKKSIHTQKGLKY